MSAAALSLEEAQERMLGLIDQLSGETVAVDDALGRYLAQPLVALRTQPPADLSAMDGYALAGDGPWQLVGESRCGVPFGGTICAGQTVRISTGAILPAGAERILIQEDAEVASGEVRATEEPQHGRHIRRKAFEFSDGDALLHAGTRIGPAHLALCRSAGRSDVSVAGKPTVAILDTGDRMVADPSTCAVHQIPASNAAMLAALASQEPCETIRPDPLPDDLDTIVAALDAHRNADIIVISGGASVGVTTMPNPHLRKPVPA